ncbi:beta-propeller domain-containing protein [Ruminococcus sp.]|uniref:beta-propeller domain-containing protein n=1 Tax=Ruminococcus sp. TaxID=41978 RepID=UPI0025FF2BCE|nr:beta-propeller domain-containing protein [Ruminococcus sp.]
MIPFGRGHRRNKFISQMEEKNKVPDKLMPQKIKDMLDEAGLAKPVIASEEKPEIKLNGGRTNALRCLAVVAAFVLVVGGAAFIKINSDNRVKQYPNTAASPDETDELDGLRSTSYRNLYSFLQKNKAFEEDNAVDQDYIFNDLLDRSNDCLRDYRAALTAKQITGNPSQLTITQGGVNITPADSYGEYKTEITYGDIFFYADEKGLAAFSTKKGNVENLGYDFFGDTALEKSILDKETYERYGCKFVPSVVAMYLQNDELYVFYDFILPLKLGTKTVDADYCGMNVYDVSDPDNIQLISEYQQPGVLESIKNTDGKVYIVSRYTQGSEMVNKEEKYDEKNTDFVPVRYVNGEKQLFDESEMYITALESVPTMTIVSSFDGNAQGSYMASKLMVLGENNICLGTDNIYIYRDYSLASGTSTTKCMLIQIGCNGGDLKFENTAILSTDNSMFGNTIGGEEYNGKLTLFSVCAGTVSYDEDGEESSPQAICTVQCFNSQLRPAGRKELAYDASGECENTLAAIECENTLAAIDKGKLYVFNVDYTANTLDYDVVADCITFVEAYSISDNYTFEKMKMSDTPLAHSKSYYTTFGDDKAIAIDTFYGDDESTGSYPKMKLYDTSKTEKQDMLINDKKVTIEVNKFMDSLDICKDEAVYKSNKKKLDRSQISSSDPIVDVDNSLIYLPLIKNEQKLDYVYNDNADDEDYTDEYTLGGGTNEVTHYLAIVKYDREGKKLSYLGKIKVDSDIGTKDTEFDEFVYTKELADTSAVFSKDGYVYIFTTKSAAAYSLKDLSKAVSTADRSVKKS